MNQPREAATSFGSEAGAYEAGRPDYPEDAVRWLLGPAPEGRRLRVADVGAGTGKLTRVAVALGAEVVAIDPDPEMLTALNRSVPGVPTFVGTAERLPLPDGSVDAAILGQAWHWVDPSAGSAEVGRVLRPGGSLGLIWNIRDETVGWVRRLGEVMGGSRAESMISGGDPPIAEPFGRLDKRSWPWRRSMTRATLTSMVRSRSYIITAEPEVRARIEAELGTLFDEIGAVGDETVELPYVTYAFRSIRP